MFKRQLTYLRSVANRWFNGNINAALKHACKAYPKFQRQLRGIANLFFGANIKAAVKALNKFLV